MTTTDELTTFLLKLRDARKRHDFEDYLLRARALPELLLWVGYQYATEPSPYWFDNQWLKGFAEELGQGAEGFQTENSDGALDAIQERIRHFAAY
jgi:hypothetical protein